VNATRRLLEEECDCVFQETDGGSDYGKDAYVDFVDAGRVTGLCVALQIKGGRSQRRAQGYGIRADPRHVEVWRDSSIPVAGIVHDAETGQLHWCDITGYLRREPAFRSGSIPVDAADILDRQTTLGVFRRTMGLTPLRLSDHPVLVIAGPRSESLGVSALFDCFALGRSDARYFISMRRSLGFLHGGMLRAAIALLAHVTPHPDILRHDQNRIEPDVVGTMTPLLRWSVGEICSLVQAVPMEEWSRGGLGEDAYMLFIADPGIGAKLEAAVLALVDEGDEDAAFWSMMVRLHPADEDAPAKFAELTRERPALLVGPLAVELEQQLADFGSVSLF
jgi:hypothetical protein